MGRRRRRSPRGATEATVLTDGAEGRLTGADAVVSSARRVILRVPALHRVVLLLSYVDGDDADLATFRALRPALGAVRHATHGRWRNPRSEGR